jgi:uncharacterized DUF497 family protein
MEIEFDPFKAKSNLAKHRISFAHARLISARKASRGEREQYHA